MCLSTSVSRSNPHTNFWSAFCFDKDVFGTSSSPGLSQPLDLALIRSCTQNKKKTGPSRFRSNAFLRCVRNNGATAPPLHLPTPFPLRCPPPGSSRAHLGMQASSLGSCLRCSTPISITARAPTTTTLLHQHAFIISFMCSLPAAPLA